MPPAIRHNLIGEPPASRDNHVLPSSGNKRTIHLNDATLDAALLHRRNELKRLHVALEDLSFAATSSMRTLRSAKVTSVEYTSL